MIYLLAIAVFAGSLVCLTALLVVAERFLLNYGPCAVDVNDGERMLNPTGGQSLLAVLADNGFTIPQACGGRGSCGYCKVIVLEGGGGVLPTETPFLSRREVRAGLRLACQVRVRQDMRVRVPDFLDVIAEMVRSGRVDRTRRWRFVIRGEEHEMV